MLKNRERQADRQQKRDKTKRGMSIKKSIPTIPTDIDFLHHRVERTNHSLPNFTKVADAGRILGQHRVLPRDHRIQDAHFV